MSLLTAVELEVVEFRSPIATLVEYPPETNRPTTKVSIKFDQVWQRRFKNLWTFVQNESQNRILQISADRDATPVDIGAMLVASGTITVTLPASSRPGDRYYVFNYDTGVITIAGTINGNAAGYQLTNQYQYAEFTSVDGSDWIVTLNN